MSFSMPPPHASPSDTVIDINDNYKTPPQSPRKEPVCPGAPLKKPLENANNIEELEL